MATPSKGPSTVPPPHCLSRISHCIFWHKWAS
jgi:hypothetical protein